VHFLVGDVSTVHTLGHSAAGRQVEHVALPDQRLCALLVEDGARIHFARDLEGDARWNVGLDKPGNHVHGRTLRGEDQMHAPARAFCARRAISSSTFLPETIIRSASSSMMTTM